MGLKSADFQRFTERAIIYGYYCNYIGLAEYIAGRYIYVCGADFF